MLVSALVKLNASHFISFGLIFSSFPNASFQESQKLMSPLLLSLGRLQQRNKSFCRLRGLDKTLLQQRILFEEFLEVTPDILELLEILLRVDGSEGKVSSFVLK